jgi:hypothetical protein
LLKCRDSLNATRYLEGQRNFEKPEGVDPCNVLKRLCFVYGLVQGFQCGAVIRLELISSLEVQHGILEILESTASTKGDLEGG